MAHTIHGEPYAAGSDTSHEAAIRAQKWAGPQGVKVYRWIVDRGQYGGTQKEAQRLIPIGQSSACGRFKALEDAGAIEKTSAHREGCIVYRAVPRAPRQYHQVGLF